MLLVEETILKFIKGMMNKQKSGSKKKSTTSKKEDKGNPKRYGEGDRKVRINPKGKAMANVSKEQLEKTGLTLRQYLNKWNKTGKRPTGKKG